MPALPTIEAATFKDVPLIKVGTFDASTGKVSVTRKMLDQMVEAYEALQRKFHAPLKLGHTETGEAMAGQPAAGWIENIRRVGNQLVADLEHVPAKVAELMESGAFRSRSIEISPNFAIDGKIYAHVVTGLALLGAELPAVSTIDDIHDFYGDESLERQPIAATDGAPAPLVITFQSPEPDDMNRAKMLEALGLPEDATDEQANEAAAAGRAAVEAAKPAEGDETPATEDAEPGGEDTEAKLSMSDITARLITSETETAKLTAELGAERKTRLDAEKEAMFTAACREGRALPAQRDMILATVGGSLTPTQFGEFIGSLPQVVPSGAIGDGGDASDVTQFTANPAERQIAVLASGGSPAAARVMLDKIERGKRLLAGAPLPESTSN